MVGMISIGIYEAKKHFSKLLRRAAAWWGDRHHTIRWPGRTARCNRIPAWAPTRNRCNEV